MERLFEMDLHDYELEDSVFSRPSARGVIFDDCGRVALVYSQKEKYYKFPGGGIHKDEDKKEALIREVENIITEQNLDEYEAEAGFILKFVHLDEAIDTNLKYKTEDFFNEIMIKRETKLLQMLKKKRGTHDNILFCQTRTNGYIHGGEKILQRF